ncbi:MAG TPA: alpha/beta hydrolase [Stellaceae bacterium]|nr:alpha/beta hydrolase [Stellaceae bacterium]
MVKFVAVAVFLLVLGITTAQAQAPGQSEVRLGIPYGPDPAQQLDLCLPAAKQPGLRPAAIMIHGGYWTMGDKGAYAALCKGAADQGIVSVSMGYRLANGDPHNRWPAQLVDAQLAVRWLRSHATDYGIDPARICALGDSAGGHLAVFLAALDHTIPGDYSKQLANVSSSIACAVDNFGPVDLSADNYWPPDQLLFGSADRTQVKALERDASPIYLIGPGTAPIMIAHGKDDKAVNIDQSMLLSEHLKQAHVPVRMIQLKGGHEFEGMSTQEMVAVLQQELEFIKAAHPRGGRAF